MQPTPLGAKTLRYLSPRPKDAHKGLFGHALVIGGGQIGIGNSYLLET
jgi:NAD(P)H-hydrate repair Nnr-like enzyme with NAD(P)H-hydrate dehydratase domain